MKNDNTTQELLQAINKNLEKSVSFKRTFIKGLINGVSTLLGATILGTLALATLSIVYNSVEEIPVIGDIIEKTPLEESINKNNPLVTEQKSN
jgi:hypothetical protein